MLVLVDRICGLPELVVGANDQDQLFALEALLEAVYVELVQIAHFRYYEYRQIELRPFLEANVHVQCYISDV